MHFPSETYNFTWTVVWCTLSFLLLAVLVSWRMLRRTLGDHEKDELAGLTKRFAAGLLNLDQYQKERAKIVKENEGP